MLQNRDVSPATALDAQIAGAVAQLGQVQLQDKVGYKRSSIIAMIVCSLAAALFLFFSVASIQSPGTGMTTVIVFVGFALLFAGFALYTFLMPIIYRYSIYVCTYGFLFIKSEQIEVVRWEDIDAVWQRVTRHYTNGVYTGTTHRYTVQRRDGLKLIVDDKFKLAEQLGNTIISQSIRVLLPRYLAAYQAGQALMFGKLSVSIQGVDNGKGLLPWSQVKNFGVNKGIVTIEREGKFLNWYSVQAADVPNLGVLMGVLGAVFKPVR